MKRQSIANKMSLDEKKEEGDFHTCEAASTEPNHVSVRNEKPPDLNDTAVTSDPEVKRHGVGGLVMFYLTRFTSYIWNFMRYQNTEPVLQKQKLLEESADLKQDSNQQDDVPQRVRDQHKVSMKNKYVGLFEGIKLEENQTLLNMIYTQMYIIEGEIEGVNKHHEFFQMEKTQKTQDTSINDIFKPLNQPECEEKDKIKTVLTKGIAGIGKTVSVQKFILDWSEGRANQDVDFMFALPFRELNLIKDQQYSLHRLLLDFHPELQDLDSKIYEESKVVFIFDGLDESRITLIFSDEERVSDVNESSSVGVLMSNLIRGDLLPSALIWITSRPAAANQVPSKYISRVTEIQGFNDTQKEEYFRKRISDADQASRIISHIRRSRSLHIMSHIPVFCWISATVLQNLIQDDCPEFPQTQTEMYIHFLLTQINMRNQKNERDPEKLLKSNRDVIVKLAELAFNQLMKGNVMFYEEDLIKIGIDIADASVYSGIFKDASVIHQRKIYYFIHLSFQEFLAALYLFYCHVVKNEELLKSFLNYSREHSLWFLLEAAVNKSQQSTNGRLYLFLRFLLGISLETNQTLLQDLLTPTINSSESFKIITQYIKDTIKGDQLLYKDFQDFIKSVNHSGNQLSPSDCFKIACMIQLSEKVLDEFDLKKFNTSDDGRRNLIPAVINCRKALFADCSLSGQCCESLSSSLRLYNSLRELDLSHNDLQDAGVKVLSNGLKSQYCYLNILRLTGCNLTDQCCESVSSFLQSSNSLRELDLSHNDLQDSGVKLLSNGMKSPHCQVNTLRLSHCMVTEDGCSFLASALRSNPSHLRELDLSYNHPGGLFDTLLNDPNYRLDKLNVDHGGPSRIRTGQHEYACYLTLDVNTAHNRLMLSERDRKVTCLKVKLLYLDHPERFDEWCQVLCKESLFERCYWEVEWSERADISVAYEGMSSKGWSTDSLFGYNEKSWSLNCFKNKFVARHNNKRKIIPVPLTPSNRVGVYLDWPSSLSFFSVSDTNKRTLLHKFKTQFTEPLFAGFGVYPDNPVSLLYY